MRKFSYRIKLTIGIGLLLLIILFNPIVTGNLFTVDGVIASITLRLLLWIFTIYLLTIFCLFIKNPQSWIEYYLKNYKNYLLLVCSTIASLGFAEFILGLKAGFQKSRVSYVNNYEFSFIWRLNSLGFRDAEFVKEKVAGTMRIFLIGDSFIEGMVKEEDAIDKCLEKKCKEDGLSCQFYNLGKSGKNLWELLAVARQLRDYNPDFLIVSMYADDIPWKYDLGEGAETKVGLYQKVKNGINSSLLLQTTDYFLIRFSKYSVYPWLKRYKGQNFYRQLMLQGQINHWIWERCEEVAILGGNRKYYQLLTERFNESHFVKKGILTIKRIYNNVGFLLLINPSKYQANSRYFAELRKAGFTCIDDQAVDRSIQDAIISWAREQNIDYLDLLPAIIQRDSVEQLFYNIDVHYNAQGNHLAAEEIYKKLKELRVLNKND
jgi:hypothetical protein